jgi:hypothetical protein
MPVPYDYYASYGYPSYYQPQYVVVVPQAAPNQPAQADQQLQNDQQATTDQQPAAAQQTPPPNCYGPQVDKSGSMLRDTDGNMIPDFTKPVTCPPQQEEGSPPPQ